MAFFDFEVTPAYLAGASIILLAVLLYSGPVPPLTAWAARSRPSASPVAAAPPAAPAEVSGYPWSRVALGGSSAPLLSRLLAVCFPLRTALLPAGL